MKMIIVSLSIIFILLRTQIPIHADIDKVPEVVINESGFIPVENGKLFYEVSGKGDPIVFLHDGILHRETWDYQFAHFMKTYKVIRYDRRGYGKSPNPEEPYSDVEDLKAVMDYLKIDKAYIIGCSAGGRLVVDFSVKYPDRVRALVLTGPIISGFDYTNHLYTRGGRINSDIRNSPEKLVKYLLEEDPYSIYQENTATKERVKALLTSNLNNIYDTKKHINRIPAPSAMESLQSIKVPVLLVSGEFDLPDVHAYIGAANALIPDSYRIIIDNAGNLAHFEKPEVFNSEVENFLKENWFFYLVDTSGIDAAIGEMKKRLDSSPKLVVIRENRLNKLGYKYIGKNNINHAIKVFEANVKLHPESANAYDSLGDALLAAGDRENSIINYKKSLELNPANRNAQDVLKRLEGENKE